MGFWFWFENVPQDTDAPLCFLPLQRIGHEFPQHLNITPFLIGSRFDNSFNITWWSALLAFILNIPPKAKKRETIDQEDKNRIVDEIYDVMGIKNGRLKYRIGLAAYLIGGILGWVIFYSQIVS